MQLEANVIIHRPPDRVWDYLGNVSNISAWDRGVAGTQSTSKDRPGVGFEFDTLAHPRGDSPDGNWGRMSYRITEADPVHGCKVQLTSSTGNARYFKSAEWRFRVQAVADGSQVFCVAQFTLHIRYMILAPIFLMMKRAIRNDLENLKRVLENE